MIIHPTTTLEIYLQFIIEPEGHPAGREIGGEMVRTTVGCSAGFMGWIPRVPRELSNVSASLSIVKSAFL